jgi:hypothetical protein
MKIVKNVKEQEQILNHLTSLPEGDPADIDIEKLYNRSNRK